MPALVHDGLVLTESTPMMEYIDDAFDGPPLRPADPALRWRMRWIMRVMDNSVCPALATTFVMLDQGILGLLIQQIIVDFSLTDTQASLLLGPAFAFVYVIVGIPLSPLIDRWTRTRIIAIGITVWSLATTACGLATNFVQLFVARMVVGAGESVNGPTAYSIVSDYFSRDRLPEGIYGLQIGAGTRTISSDGYKQTRLSSNCQARSAIPVSFVQQHGMNRAIPLAGRNFAA